MAGWSGAGWWNFSFIGGFVPGVISLALGSLTFWLVHLCIAELATAVPFSTGVYGFARLGAWTTLAWLNGWLGGS